MQQLRIVYMGTPDFAVEPLRRLLDHGCQVVGVVTMPDKPVGRHQHTLTASPVKAFALSRGLPVLQPEKLKAPEFLEALEALHADLQIVVAFRMLPEVVWGMPPRGTFNLHAALLPQYRGAAPINWAVINGETRTGVTTFFLDHDIDTGRVIMQKPFDILDEYNVENVYDGLMHLGAEICLDTLQCIIDADGHPDAIPQEQLITAGETLLPAPKIFKETCEIDWSKDAKQVYDFVRGLSPYPGAWTTLVDDEGRETVLKIYSAKKTGIAVATGQMAESASEAGGIVIREKRQLCVVAGDGLLLQLDEVQLAGKKRMKAQDFINGMKKLAQSRLK